MHFTSVINRNWYPYANPENFVSNPVTTVIVNSIFGIGYFIFGVTNAKSEVGAIGETSPWTRPLPSPLTPCRPSAELSSGDEHQKK